MKLKFTLFYPLIFALLLPLCAQESTSGDSAVEEEKELPEYSHPPFSVGDRAIIQGHYIPVDDAISINFRILNNRMFVYWVDQDDLIVEPQASSGNVRFLAGVRGRNFFAMEPLPGEAGLGSVGGPILNPHNFTVILSLEKAGSGEWKTYPTFRYSLTTSDVRETREFPPAGPVDSKNRIESKSSSY